MGNGVMLLALVVVANGTPLVVRLLCGARLAFPVDTGLKLPDGQPLFGRAKTIRGILVSLVATALAARGFGLPWTAGAGIAVAAMAGDLLSSFVKRRLCLAPSSDAPGLDQVPESLLPAFVYRSLFEVTWPGLLLLVFLFLIIDLVFTRILHRLVPPK